MKEMGKIESCEFGFGGYQDAMIGVSFVLSGDGWGCGDFWGHWSAGPGPHAEWTEEDREKKFGKVVMGVNELLKDAKKDQLSKLAGTPIEAIFDAPGGRLLSWRILKEVL